jgi:hypothetical protein
MGFLSLNAGSLQSLTTFSFGLVGLAGDFECQVASTLANKLGRGRGFVAWILGRSDHGLASLGGCCDYNLRSGNATRCVSDQPPCLLGAYYRSRSRKLDCRNQSLDARLDGARQIGPWSNTLRLVLLSSFIKDSGVDRLGRVKSADQDAVDIPSFHARRRFLTRLVKRKIKHQECPYEMRSTPPDRPRCARVRELFYCKRPYRARSADELGQISYLRVGSASEERHPHH